MMDSTSRTFFCSYCASSSILDVTLAYRRLLGYKLARAPGCSVHCVQALSMVRH